MKRMQEVIDRLDIAAKDYPIKALAPELNKGESTLRNELTEQPGCKLGLTTSLLIMQKTNDLRALDLIEAMFNRVAFVIPPARTGDMRTVVEMLAKISKEFGEHMTEAGKTMEDGTITEAEARSCLTELQDLIEACLHFKGYMEQFVK